MKSRYVLCSLKVRMFRSACALWIRELAGSGSRAGGGARSGHGWGGAEMRVATGQQHWAPPVAPRSRRYYGTDAKIDAIFRIRVSFFFFEMHLALEVIEVKIARRRRDRAQSHMSNSLKTRVRKSNQSAPSCRREIRRACQESRRDRTM